MPSRNSPRLQAAVREYLDGADEDRAELVRERGEAIRSGDQDSALKYSKDLRMLHKDHLAGGLKAVLIQHSIVRERIQHVGPEWPQYEGYERIFGREVADEKLKEWKGAKSKEAAQESLDPTVFEKFTTENIWDIYFKRMEGEKIFLENLKRVSQQNGKSSIVRACRIELRQLRNDMLEGQKEIGNFERDNPPPVDHRAYAVEIWATRFKVIEAIRKVAERSGINLDNPE